MCTLRGLISKFAWSLELLKKNDAKFQDRI
jgi:hypothetical protein